LPKYGIILFFDYDSFDTHTFTNPIMAVFTT